MRRSCGGQRGGLLGLDVGGPQAAPSASPGGACLRSGVGTHVSPAGHFAEKTTEKTTGERPREGARERPREGARVKQGRQGLRSRIQKSLQQLSSVNLCYAPSCLLKYGQLTRVSSQPFRKALDQALGVPSLWGPFSSLRRAKRRERPRRSAASALVCLSTAGRSLEGPGGRSQVDRCGEQTPASPSNECSSQPRRGLQQQSHLRLCGDKSELPADRGAAGGRELW